MDISLSFSAVWSMRTQYFSLWPLIDLNLKLTFYVQASFSLLLILLVCIRLCHEQWWPDDTPCVQCQQILYCGCRASGGKTSELCPGHSCVILASQNCKFDLDRENVSLKLPILAKTTRYLKLLLLKEVNKFTECREFVHVTHSQYPTLHCTGTSEESDHLIARYGFVRIF